MKHTSKTLAFLTLVSAIILAPSGFAAEQNHFNSESTLKSHLAKVQLYRWYQLYERPMNDARIANQMALFDENIIINSTSGQLKGKPNYPDALQRFKGWKNAHHVQSVTVTNTEKGAYQLTANIIYQGIKPDGEKSSYRIDYNTKLTSNGDLLPVFANIDLNVTGPAPVTFDDSYADNRMLSLLHYWLALMEQLDGNVEPFKEILTDDFRLNLSAKNNNINNIESFTKWLNGVPLQLQQSSHHIKNFSAQQIGADLYQLQVDFDWYGIMKTGQRMTAKTRHIWQVVDNPNERFARVQKVDVETLEDFKILK
ncbi:hypothetical protein CBF23_013830 [Marinomonas agarivorans]|nr:hypothetical protein CBF23_013830 [Marinomonas agarivorans]